MGANVHVIGLLLVRGRRALLCCRCPQATVALVTAVMLVSMGVLLEAECTLTAVFHAWWAIHLACVAAHLSRVHANPYSSLS